MYILSMEKPCHCLTNSVILFSRVTSSHNRTSLNDSVSRGDMHD